MGGLELGVCRFLVGDARRFFRLLLFERLHVPLDDSSLRREPCELLGHLAFLTLGLLLALRERTDSIFGAFDGPLFRAYGVLGAKTRILGAIEHLLCSMCIKP